MFLRTHLGRRSGRKSEGECEGEREGQRERASLRRAEAQVPSRSAIAPCTPKYHVRRGDCRASHAPSRGRGGRCNVAWPAANGVRERERGKRGAQPGAHRNGGREIALGGAEPCLRWRSSRIIKVVSNKGLVHRVISSIVYKRLYQYITDCPTIPIHN